MSQNYYPFDEKGFPEWGHYDEPEPDENYCHHCGKHYEDFSDLGCEYCDSRHPLYGTVA